MRSFEHLGVRAEISGALARRGITEPFPIQELTIPDALAGRDVCGKAKTGSGKTFAFGLPLLHRLRPASRPARPAGLVLVPTRELARQVVDELAAPAEAVGLSVAAFYGGTPVERDVARLRRPIDLVVATPGRLIDLIDRSAIDLSDVEILVIDEADRMADMGFSPQVDWIMRRLPSRDRQILLFSATLDSEVDVLVSRYLRNPVHHEVESDTVTVEDMVHRFLAVHRMDRVRVAAAITRGVSRTLLFARTKRGADRLALDLRREGVRVQAIHGDLRQGARERALRDFKAGRIEALVATDVAARGIHVDEVDVVVHFDPPADHKSYLHRSGRTARAGRAGVVATFVLWDQATDVDRIKARLGIEAPTVEIFSNDARLADLAAFSLPTDAPSLAS
ncbi:MAG TPA: DEAD/DEAH box helicase [Acidimicrobiales bacterium]|nr:DEAD/DEAH box helicase [Acidimicrobiales bacterium]